MTGQNIDIFRPEWLNVVFADRNQAYGAYQLRKDNARTTNRALLIALSIFVLIMAVPTLINKLRGVVPEQTLNTQVDKRIIDNEQVYKIIPPKTEPKHNTQAVSPPVNDMTRNPPLVAAHDATEQPPTQTVLEHTESGPVTMAGTHTDGPPVVDANPGKVSVAGTGSGTPAVGAGDEVYPVVEINPEYPGGEAAFGKFLQKNIRYPQIAKENGVQGKAYLQFIVERDGSLTDIKIIKSPGSGTGEEAARVLKMSPHWKPGVQNGNKVRVQYTIPVNFSLGDQN
jgi:protein TonB